MALLRRTGAVLLSAALLSCAHAPNTTIDRLFFGMNIPAGGEVSEDEWKSFVRDVVTPQFKEGLTIFDANGQWVDPRGILVREHVKVLEVTHPANTSFDATLEAIAQEYKKRFHQDAVLRMTMPATMRFY